MLIPAGEGSCKAFVAPELLIPPGTGATGYTCYVQTHVNTEAGTVQQIILPWPWAGALTFQSLFCG